MAFEPEFLDFATEILTLEPLSTHGAHGEPMYSTTTQTFDVYVEPDEQLVRGNDGKEVLTKFSVVVMSSSASIGTEDRIVVSGHSTKLNIVRVMPRNDDEGQHHVELLLT